MALERAPDPRDLDQVDADLHVARVEPVRQVGDRREDRVGHDPRPLDRVGPELAGADERGAHPVQLRAARCRPRCRRRPSTCARDRRRPPRAPRAKYVGLGLPRTVASIPAAYSSPATNAPESSSGPARRLPPRVLVQAVELRAGLELGERAAQGSCTRRRGSSPASRRRPRSARPRRNRRRAARPRGRRGSPASSSASTRLPASACAAARRRRLELVVLELDAHRAELLGERARDCVVLFVTKRRRCPSSRSRRTAAAAPGIGAPETCSTPSTSRRMAAMDGESIRVTRSVLLPLVRDRASASRARAAPAGSTRTARRRGWRPASTSRPLRRSPPGRSAGCSRGSGPDDPRRRPGRAEPVAEPRARRRSAWSSSCARRCGSSAGAGRRSRPLRRASGASRTSAAARRRSGSGGIPREAARRSAYRGRRAGRGPRSAAASRGAP